MILSVNDAIIINNAKSFPFIVPAIETKQLHPSTQRQLPLEPATEESHPQGLSEPHRNIHKATRFDDSRIWFSESTLPDKSGALFYSSEFKCFENLVCYTIVTMEARIANDSRGDDIHRPKMPQHRLIFSGVQWTLWMHSRACARWSKMFFFLLFWVWVKVKGFRTNEHV